MFRGTLQVSEILNFALDHLLTKCKTEISLADEENFAGFRRGGRSRRSRGGGRQGGGRGGSSGGGKRGGTRRGGRGSHFWELGVYKENLEFTINTVTVTVSQIHLLYHKSFIICSVHSL